MNAGVMLMNLENLAAQDFRFKQYVADHLLRLTKSTWDQEAYKKFYGRKWPGKPKWDRLKKEYNWKPYWGDYSPARLVHFHGPKPFQRDLIRSNQAPDILRWLATGSYFELCEIWDDLLAEASAP